jgi:hypothetical protein
MSCLEGREVEAEDGVVELGGGTAYLGLAAGASTRATFTPYYILRRPSCGITTRSGILNTNLVSVALTAAGAFRRTFLGMLT